MKKITLLVLLCITFLLAGCGEESHEKTFVYGTMAYGTAMGNVGTNPHDGYAGWSCVRYSVGETLFCLDENMKVVPFLAEGYEQLDDYRWKINLRDDVFFSNGKKMTGEAVKKCLENLVEVHDRAPADLKIKEIIAEGQSVIITTTEKVPALVNFLADPYAAIIDMEAGEQDKIVVGTGAYVPARVTDREIELVKNENYWGAEKPKLDKIIVKSITDGETLKLALQKGEIDAAQGLSYASLEEFRNDEKFTLSAADTSRVYQVAFNFRTKPLQDIRVRQAIALCLDRENFAKVLLNGGGTAALGIFPRNMEDGTTKVFPYDLAKAKELLRAAGYADTDGDGVVEKDGEKLTLRYLTYTSRQELPLLAQLLAAELKKIGIELKVNATDSYRANLKNGDYDIYANAFVTAPTGDREYYFNTHALKNSAYNAGFYANDEMEKLAANLKNTFNPEKREAIAKEMEQKLIDDSAYIYAAHLKMTLVMKKTIVGLTAHPSDYYEITAALDKL